MTQTATIQTELAFFPGHALALFTTFNPNGPPSWQTVQAGTPKNGPQPEKSMLVKLGQILLDEVAGTQLLTKDVPLTIMYESGSGANPPAGLEPNPDGDYPSINVGYPENTVPVTGSLVGEPGIYGPTNPGNFVHGSGGSLLAAEGIWNALVEAGETINGMMLPFFLATNNCETAVVYMDNAARIPTLLPTNEKFDIVGPFPGFYQPLAYKGGIIKPVILPVAITTYLAQYTLDNASHLRYDASILSLLKTDSYMPSEAGPYNTITANSNQYVYDLIHFFVPNAPPGPVPAGPSPFSTLSMPELQSAVESQVTYLQSLGQTVALFEGLAPDTASFDQYVILPLESGGAADAVGLLNALLGSKAQISTVMGSASGGATLDGSAGNLLLVGFTGGNTLIAGGNDELFGGLGANTYLFGAASLTASPAILLDYDQGDTLTPGAENFEPSEGDTIDVSAIVGQAYAQGAVSRWPRWCASSKIQAMRLPISRSTAPAPARPG